MALYSNFITQHPLIKEKYFPIKYFTTSTIGEMYTSDDFLLTLVNNTNLPHLIREVDIYSSISHPCIGELEEYAIGESVSVIVVRKGIGLEKAVKEGMVSLLEVATDLLSGIYFLHSKGIAHHNLKKSNVVYDPKSGRCKIIDFKYVERCEKFEDTYYCFSRNRSYPDPEEAEYYPLVAEMYSVAMTLYSLIEEPPLFYPIIDGLVDEEVRDIYNSLTEFLDIRSFPKVLPSKVKTRIVRDFENGMMIEPVISKEVETPLIGEIRQRIIEDLAIEGVMAREAFLIAHNFKRVLASIQELEKLSKKNLMSIFKSCVYLVRSSKVGEISSQSSGFYRLIADNLRRMGGVVTVKTPYDAVPNRRDLPFFFADIFAEEYTFDGVPPSTDSRNSRRVKFSEFADEVSYFFGINYDVVDPIFYPLFEILPNIESKINSGDIIRINPELRNEIGVEKYYIFVRSIISNRDTLSLLSGGEGALVARALSKTGLIYRLLGWAPTEVEADLMVKECINPFAG